MVTPLTFLKETPSQTAGPYVHIGTTPNWSGLTGVIPHDLGLEIIKDGCKGERITVTGRIIDGGGNPVSDCVIELWQADAAGIYNSPEEHRSGVDPNFVGWGRCAADETGRFTFKTIKPGAVPGPNGAMMAPHLTLWIVARGINTGLHTRMYFPEEEAANAKDGVLSKARMIGRDETMVAKRDGDTLNFDIYLRGENETVFLDI